MFVLIPRKNFVSHAGYMPCKQRLTKGFETDSLTTFRDMQRIETGKAGNREKSACLTTIRDMQRIETRVTGLFVRNNQV